MVAAAGPPHGGAPGSAAPEGLDAARVRLLVGLASASVLGAGLAPASVVDTAWALVRGHLFTSGALASAFVVHALTVRDPTARRRAFVIGALAEAVLGAVRAAAGLDPSRGVGTGLGLVGLLLGALEAHRARGSARAHAQRILSDQVVLASLALVSQPLLALTGRLRPEVWDGYVLHAEQGFGVQPSLVFGALFAAVPPLAGLSALVYVLLPVGLALVHGARQRASPGARPDLLLSVYGLGVLGGLLYFVFPCVGPAVVAGRWPVEAFDLAVPPEPAWVFAALHPRNCMPSLHTSWALVLAWQTRPLAWRWRAFGAGWAALTIVATLGLGEHWLVDLVAALPFASGVEAACSAEVPRGRGARAGGAGLAVLAAWLVSLRVGWRVWETNPGAILAASAATVLFAGGLRRWARADFAALSAPDPAP